MTAPQVAIRPDGSVVLEIRTGQRRPIILPRNERERLQLALVAVRREARGSSREAIRVFRIRMAQELARALPRGSGPLTHGKARELTRAVDQFLQQVERLLLDQTRQAVAGVLRAQRDNFPNLTPTFARRARAAARSGLRPLRSSARLVTAASRQEIAAYIRSVTGKEPTEVAINAIERILGGRLPVEISGVTNAAGTVKRAERVIVSETLNTMREGNRLALTAQGGLAAQWTTSGLPNVCQKCLDIAALDLGFGKGWFPPQLWPKAPHPYCGCFQGPIRDLTADEEVILKGLLRDGVTVFGVLGFD